MICLDRVSKSYLLNGMVRVDALKDFSYVFPASGFYFVLGKSGSGKSTLLHILAAMDSPSGGDISINGFPLAEEKDTAMSAIRANMVGCVFQEANLINEFDVGDNVRMGLSFSSECGIDVESALREVGLEGFANRNPVELSGGQRQRVAIARALAKRPKALICDEPTSSLDPDSAAAIFSLLKEISKTTLVICATHDEAAAFRYGDNILRLESGRLLGDSMVEVDATKPHFEGDTYVIPNGYRLSEREKESIAHYYADPDSPKSQAFRAGYYLKEPEPREETQPCPMPAKKRLRVFDSLRIAFSAFAKKKLRLVLTVFLNAIALLLVGVAGSMIPFDARENALQNLLAAPYGYLNFSYGTKDPVSMLPSVVGSLTEMDGEAISRRIEERCYPIFRQEIILPSSLDSMQSPNYARALNGIGLYSEGLFRDFSFHLAYGSYPNGPKDVLLSQDAAKTFLDYPEPGRQYPDFAAVVGADLGSGFRVCGVFEHRIDLSAFDALDGYIQNAFNSGSRLSRLAYLRSEMNKQSPVFSGYMAELPNEPNAATDYIAPFDRNAATIAHGTYWGDEGPGIILNHISSTLGSFGNDVATGIKIGSAVASILMSGLVVGADYLLISFSVERKRREISVLRSMGASKMDVAMIYVLESLLIGTLSAGASMAASYFVVASINNAFLDLVALSIPIFPFGPLAIALVAIVALLAVSLSSVPNIVKIVSRAPYEGIASE